MPSKLTTARKALTDKQSLISWTLLLGLAIAAIAGRSSVGASSPQGSVAPSYVSDWSYDGEQSGDELGYSVSTAGDVNGDGYYDVIVGAPRATHQVYKEGVAYAFYGSPAGPSLSPDWTVGSGQQGALFGASVSTAGDVNGDGYDDVIVGAYGYINAIQVKSGAAFVFLGSKEGLDEVPHRILLGAHKDAHFGVSVSTAGDVDGDNFDDVIVGARWHTDDETNEGAAFVFHGSASGLSSVPNWTATGDQPSAGFGISVDTAGDVDGDGYGDVIVGAPFYVHTLAGEGAAFVFYGSDSGLSVNLPWIAYGAQEGAEFGTSVGGAGDVDHDGYDDVVVGAPSYDGEVVDEGAAFAFYGSDLGPSANYDWMTSSGQGGSGFGISVRTAGNVNGDLYADVIVGALRYEVDQSLEGAAFVYCGTATGLRTEADWKAEGNKAEPEFGFSVSTAGDVDGDTKDNVIIGAPRYRIEQDPVGRAFVYHGPVLAVRTYLPLVLR